MIDAELIGWGEHRPGLEREDLLPTLFEHWTGRHGVERRLVRLREHAEHRGPWQELSWRVADIPQVMAVHRAPGEEVEELWIAVTDELSYQTVRQISDAVADIQLKFGFVTNTHLVRSEEEIPGDGTLIWRRLG